ncbi:MAG: hypothetical protein KAH57_11565 [Thermoplasmata archaeon]|nr:hypothetical protein [Thermoplasmata archaeon]
MMERYDIHRSIPAILLALMVAATIFYAFVEVGFGEPEVDKEDSVSNRFISNSTQETGSSNFVTAVVVNYRGFDTLGEVTVLFLASAGMGAIVSALPAGDKRKRPIPPSLILTAGTRLVLPLIILFGAYVFVHGHLSPGGGFQGGVIIASGLLLYIVIFPEWKAPHKALALSESLAGLSFAGIGIIGLAVGGIFLDNVISGLGEAGMLVSAGLIPLIYIAIGIKVGAEMTGLVARMKGGDA